MTTFEKPLPNPTIDSKEFWEYAAKHELRMQKCSVCGFIRFPPGFVCPNCHTIVEPEWGKLSGKGTVYSFVVFHYLYNKAFAPEMPYVAATIELEEGPRMLSNITGIKPEDVKIGMAVEVYFEDTDEELSLPKFRPTST